MCTEASILHTNCFSFDCFLSPVFFPFIIALSLCQSIPQFDIFFLRFSPPLGRLFIVSWERVIMEVGFIFILIVLLSDMNIILTSKKHRCFIF